MNIDVQIATDGHVSLAESVCHLMAISAKIRGTGIAKRSPEYIRKKMKSGDAVIATCGTELVGFCYIETWEHGRFVANSGLVVAPKYRNQGLARKIKARIFNLASEKFPQAKIFGITTSLAVMKINSDLGYQPVTFSELPQDDSFWQGCQSCKNYDILQRNNQKLCLCTGMLAEPKDVIQSQVEFDLTSLILNHEK